jgi:hypothetical protein
MLTMKGMKITTVHLPVRRASPGGGKPPGGRLAAVTGVAERPDERPRREASSNPKIRRLR